MTPMRMEFSVLSSQFSVLGTRYSVLGIGYSLLLFHLLEKLADANDCATHGSLTDFLKIIAGDHVHRVETAIKRFQRGLGLNVRADSARGAVLDVDRSADGDLIAFAVWVQRVKRCGLHQADHVGRGVYRWKFRMVRGQGVLE